MDFRDRINVLLRTFPGLSLPKTVSFALPAGTTTTDLLEHLTTIIPPSISAQLILTTTSNRTVRPSPNLVTSLISPTNNNNNNNNNHGTLLPLQLHAPLPGGKGGFGAQLRAAGGRMSSRKRKNALASDPNAGVGSNRNLDGRRLRSITEAKNLAEYLATKPEMERREKEERRRRWEAVVEGAERREEEMRKGKRGKGLSEEWLEEREDAGERTREAVRKAMAGGNWKDNVAGMAASQVAVDGGAGASAIKILEKEAADGDVDAIWVLRNRVKKPAPKEKEETRYVGFDEDDEFMSSSGDEQYVPTIEGKGKEKVSS
ncbi:hypothetical protein EPUS_06326 [Endocarpon pusillum Z07020]|uniref:Uncharacterized protein n=1 Tax=Endocarpon pusillum (strain Z07020 / HMAS-L-300199) TaxID=1263415 RepID=U1HJ96_ENDPU|nr:uncharacterized protein EPUS_06326 [Endocarpon pusillum Z07020]ERF70285.1 hypothetical protein EPUS_06326 [Endocarpon pusillum Z07020]